MTTDQTTTAASPYRRWQAGDPVIPYHPNPGFLAAVDQLVAAFETARLERTAQK